MLRTNLWTITMQNVSGIKKWNHEKLPLNFAMQFPFPFPVIPGNNNISFPFPKCGNEALTHSSEKRIKLELKK